MSVAELKRYRVKCDGCGGVSEDDVWAEDELAALKEACHTRVVEDMHPGDPLPPIGPSRYVERDLCPWCHTEFVLKAKKAKRRRTPI